MREFNRVKRIQELITKIWNELPDFRYFQLVSMLEQKCANHNDIHFYERPDLFYLEDDKFEKFLIEFKENLTR